MIRREGGSLGETKEKEILYQAQRFSVFTVEVFSVNFFQTARE